MAVTRPEVRVHLMTYPPQPARSGMPTWAKWTMIGCAGCLTVVILLTVGCGALFYQYFGKNIKRIDMSDKPDLPPTATAGQLLPPRVGPFVRKQVSRVTPQLGSMTLPVTWRGIYTSGGQQVQLEVRRTRASSHGSDQGSESFPFGRSSPSANKNMGIHMSMKVRGVAVDVVSWAKPNWTFTVTSQSMVAEKFARAYQPGRLQNPHRSPPTR
jgi:hypothetical protein